MEIKKAVKEYLVEIEIRKFTPKTIRSYRNNLNLFLRFCQEQAGIEDTEDISLPIVKKFMQHMISTGKKGSYVNGLLKVAKVFIQYCYEEGYGGFNTKKNFRWCKQEKAVVLAFKPEDVKAMLKSCKLWIYFAKNQNGHQFALSSKDAEDSFGLKIKQYNNAVKELIEKGYLIKVNGNYYAFKEIPVITKEDNEKEKNSLITKSNNNVITERNKDVITKEDNELLQKEIRNITNTTYNTTFNTTASELLPKEDSETNNCSRSVAKENAPSELISKTTEPSPKASKEAFVPKEERAREEGTVEYPYRVDKNWLIERINCLIKCKNNRFFYQGKFYIMKEE